MCAIAVECVSFVRIGFRWMLWWRLITRLYTLLQSRHIILWIHQTKRNYWMNENEWLNEFVCVHSPQHRRIEVCAMNLTICVCTCDIMSPLAVRTWYKYRYLRCLASSRVSRGRLDARWWWWIGRRRDRDRLLWSTRHAVIKHCTNILNTITIG